MDSDSSVAILLRNYKQLTLWISLIILLFTLTNRLRRIFTPGLRDVPGPRLARVTRLWNLVNVASGKLHERTIAAHKTYGPIVRTGPWHISISDPEMIPVIYGVHTKFIKSAFYEPFIFQHEGNTMDGLFATRSPKRHAVIRSSVAQIYSMTSITQLEPLVEICTEILMHSFTSLSLSHEPFDLGAWLQWYAFDVIGYMTFQRRFGFMEERRDIRGLIIGIEKGISYFTHVGQYPELHRFLLGSSFMERVLKFLAAFSPALKDANPRPWIAEIVNEEIKRYDLEAEAAPSQRGDFLAWFRRQQQKDPAHFSDFDIFSNCFGNIMAGSDTTAIALRSIIYHLIKTPRVYQKLQDEIDESDQEGLLSPIIKYHESLKLPYLQAVIKEALRIHPSVGFPLERVVPEGGATLCGIHVPAGTIVGMNAFVLSKNTDVFGPDVDAFRPERWIEASSDELKIMDRSFLAFGYGTRICTGKNISMMEMCKLIPTLVRAFEIQWVGDVDKNEWEIENQWFARQKGLVVRFWPRLQRHRVEKDSLGKIRDGKD